MARLQEYKKLLTVTEEESLIWPIRGSERDFERRKLTRLSAIYYALGLSQLLHGYAKARYWDAKDLKPCLTSLEASVQKASAGLPYTWLLSDLACLAKGKVLLLLALNERWKSSLKPNSLEFCTSKAVMSFKQISSRNSVVGNEREDFILITRAYKEGKCCLPKL